MFVAIFHFTCITWLFITWFSIFHVSFYSVCMALFCCFFIIYLCSYLYITSQVYSFIAHLLLFTSCVSFYCFKYFDFSNIFIFLFYYVCGYFPFYLYYLVIYYLVFYFSCFLLFFMYGFILLFLYYLSM